MPNRRIRPKSAPWLGPLWSTRQGNAISRRGEAQPLLDIIEEYNLQLLTAHGATTHRWNGGESTIDLTFATEEIATRVHYCKTVQSLDCDSDHLPIGIALDWSFQHSEPPKKRMWSKTDIAMLQRTTKEQIARRLSEIELITESDVDRYVSGLVDTLRDVDLIARYQLMLVNEEAHCACERKASMRKS